MFSIIWFIFFIWIIVTIKKKKDIKKKEEEEYQRKWAQKFSNEKKDSSNSYYPKKKVEQYKRMNQLHSDHEEEFDDVCNTIGYKRCPKCDTLLSKKADHCFMCDYAFQDEKNSQS